jgi:predicted ferric reductase
MQPLSTRFSNFFEIFTSIGQISGLIGLVLLSITFVLNARIKFLEKYFRGLDKMYNSHHLIGSIGFILLLFHPLSLAVRFFPNFKQSQSFLFSFSNLSVNLGIIGLIIMIILIFLTFFVKLKYNNWKISHKFLGLALIFSILHLISINSDVSRNILLKYYMIFISFLGLCAYFYKTIFNIHNKKYYYVVENVREISSNIVELTLKPKDRSLKYTAGQFAFVKVLGKSFSKEQHPFTISSSPEEKSIRFNIKNLGDYTSQLKNIQIGSEVEIEGPYGMFYSHSKLDEIWIAGGIGITPFLSRLKSIPENKKVYLFFSLKNKNQDVFFKELERTAKENKNFKVFINYSEEKGHINIDKIRDKLGIFDKDIFLCGPKLMTESIKCELIRAGVNKALRTYYFLFLK